MPCLLWPEPSCNPNDFITNTLGRRVSFDHGTAPKHSAAPALPRDCFDMLYVLFLDKCKLFSVKEMFSSTAEHEVVRSRIV